MRVRVPSQVYMYTCSRGQRDSGGRRERIEAVPAEFTMINRHRLLIVLDLDEWALGGQQPLYFGHHKEPSANDSLTREECTTHRLEAFSG